MKICGVYQIQSKIKPERVYIGSSINFKNRRMIHLRDLRKDKHGCHKLQNHYNKYGEDDLIFSILLCCEKLDLIKHEQFFIDSLNPFFNECRIAGSVLGRIHSKKTKIKIGNGNRGKVHSEETLEKQRKSHLGHHPTIETLEKMKLSQQGKKMPRDAVERAAAKRRGFHHSAETKKILSEQRKGIKTGRIVNHTDDTKNKIKKSLILYYETHPESKEIISLFHKGKKDSPETTAKRKIAQTERRRRERE